MLGKGLVTGKKRIEYSTFRGNLDEGARGTQEFLSHRKGTIGAQIKEDSKGSDISLDALVDIL